MINRIVRILTNKPTQITKPIFAKEFNKHNKQIKDLEILLNQVDEKSKTYIENDIKKMKYGIIGENNIYYELKNSFIPMVCLHDIRIEYKTFVAQIDFIVITTKCIYVIESKNLIGDILVTENGEFIRYKKDINDNIIAKEGMYSPIIQNERHINILSELLKDKLSYKHKLKRIQSLVVIANAKTIVEKECAPKEVSDKIVKYDHLISLISSVEKNKNIDWVFTEEDMMSISNCLIENHKEKEIDYVKKYSLNNIENKESIKIINKDCVRSKLKKFRLNKSKEEDVKAYMIFKEYN